MPQPFGDFNPDLTRAVKRVVNADTAKVRFSPHAEEEMGNDDFDHEDVLTCLRRGQAYGPEIQNGQTRANVVHRGLHIRVVVGGFDATGDWTVLTRVTVVTVMRIT